MNASCYQAKGVGNVVTLFRAREAKAPYNVTPKSQAVKVEVVDSEELSYDELQERTVLEQQVERVFYIAGRALLSLREKDFIETRILLLNNIVNKGLDLLIVM